MVICPAPCLFGYNFSVAADSIESALRDLQRFGQLIKDRPYRQIWRIVIDGRPYFLKFYPRPTGKHALKRLARGNPALREFHHLQTLQKARIPAPLVVSVLMGFRIGAQIGDAVLMHAIELSVTLDRYCNDLELSAQPIPARRDIANQILAILQQLIQAGLGHRDLHLGNFLLSDGKVYLLDAYAIHRRMQKNDLLMLGHSVRPYATKSELLRAWRTLGGVTLPSANNRISRRFWKKETSRIFSQNAYFGRSAFNDWTAHYFKLRKYPPPWSTVARMQLTDADWQNQIPRLLAQIESGQFLALSPDQPSSALAGEIILAGVPTKILIKPHSAKLWRAAWSLIVRGIPIPWPLLLMRRKRLGLPIQEFIVYEDLAGSPLSHYPLTELSRAQRDHLFHRVGSLLRQLESLGFYCKNLTSTQILLRPDLSGNLFPILDSIEAIRPVRGNPSSLLPLLVDLRATNPAYNPPDSYALCRGYGPSAKMQKEK